YNEDLAPVPRSKRTWSKWNLAALWVGVAVCIPTYILASYMIKSGLSWSAALIIIALANLFITIPMVLNGHAGVKYGIPFPVFGRAAFGIKGIHLPALLRALVACGWFGIQTWIGGLAIYSLYTIAANQPVESGLTTMKFVGFIIFWFINIYFIWRGTESIKKLENFAAPLLILIGVLLIVWGYNIAGTFGTVLSQSSQLEKPVATYSNGNVSIQSLKNPDGSPKASEYSISTSNEMIKWNTLNPSGPTVVPVYETSQPLFVQLRTTPASGTSVYSSIQPVQPASESTSGSLWTYIIWFTAMVGFWATMSISISDITRFAKSQKDQVLGQFMGLPGTMLFYSFVGIFVTCAAVIGFKDVLIPEDAPWDPVNLVGKFNEKWLVLISQIALLIATLSTNIAANVIAPSYAFSNLFPKKISFRVGGVITGLIGIAMCPWLLLDSIGNILIFISGLLGPVVGILICDYFLIRRRQLKLQHLYSTNGDYAYGSTGVNMKALVALIAGILVAVAGRWIPQLEFLFNLAWFTGFFVAFVLYAFLMKKQDKVVEETELSLEPNIVVV
ncbi:MAG TPA: NCS1 family nucleobase:cation symporter-1, partial [Flavisolibacter sp.]|nr:NCS1 family nucleobase:cation symporter-1 [Flavisolibacter sp.]